MLERPKFFSMLRSHLRNHRGQAFIVGVLLVGEVIAELVKPWPMKFVIDYLTTEEGGTPDSRVPIPGIAGDSVTSFLIFAGVAIIGFALFDAVVTYFGTYWRNRLGTQIGVDLRRRAFAHLQRLGLDFHHSQRSGELTTRVVNDAANVEGFVSDSLPSLVRVTATFASMVAIMFWLDWRLALVTTVVIPPVMFVVIAHFVDAIKARSREQRKTVGSLTALTQETLQSIQLVKTFSREDFTDELFDRENESNRDARMDTVVVEAKFTPTIKTMVQIGVVMMLVFGVLRVRAGALSTGDLWVFLAYFRGIKGPLKELTSALRQLARTEARWEKIADILAIPETSQDPSRREAPRFLGGIEFRNVFFSYNESRGDEDGLPDEPTVLRDVSLSIPPGQRVAIVGVTGVGKSTLVSLIASLYEPSSGVIEIDGTDLSELQPHTVREQIAFVLQDSILFATTIEQNIAYGRLDATSEEIVLAAKQARIHEFIMQLPAGYQTVIGERGTTLSGGQRQRLAIARAVLRRAPILILDEPVSALDMGTHDEVWSEMHALMEGRTTILITHDPQLARDMDVVYHLRNGRLIRDDSHSSPRELSVSEQLIAESGVDSDTPGLGERVVIVGQGYVGLPIAIRAVSRGFDVVGFDLDVRRISTLTAGHSFIDDISDAEVVGALGTGRFRPSANEADLVGFDHAVIAVPTPLRDGSPDVSYIEAAGRTLGRYLRPGASVILESTTYPGTTDSLVRPILESLSGLTAGEDFYLGYSPERINPGDKVNDFVRIPKVVSGIDKESLEHVDGFYRRLIDTTVRVDSTRVAELTKLLENTFRHVNIALVNELARFAHELDIDIWDAIDAAETKPFGFMPFRPGPGVGGHCLPVDPSYLSWDVRRSLGQSFRFVDLANDINEQMPDYVVQRVAAALNERGQSLRGRRILALGMAYKPDTGDTRQSPALRIIAKLVALGAAVSVADPHVDPGHSLDGVERVSLNRFEVEQADAVVLLVNHSVFDYDLIEDYATFVFDCCNRLGNYPHIESL